MTTIHQTAPVIVLIALAVFLFTAGPWCVAQETTDPDAEFLKRFQEQYPPVESPPTLEAYATAERYDQPYLGDSLNKALENVSNETGGIAWGMASRMWSLNEMFRATGDTKYLDANLRCIQAVLAARDDVTNTKTWTDVVAPAWSSGKYAQRGRAVFAVHTGIITYPMLDFVGLVKATPEYAEKQGEQADIIARKACESVDFHDRQWRDGPGEGEGHYIGLDQEDVCENKPLPGNRLSAMGLALWQSWKVTGNETHRDRAVALGHYVKNRLTLAPDGAYYWPYWLPEEPVTGEHPKKSVKGEDVSHASLTMAFPILLAQDGQVFTKEDMQRVANTVVKGFGRLGNGTLFGDVTGNPASHPKYAGGPGKWLPLAQYDGAVRERLVAFYLNYKPAPSPLCLAMLLRFGNAE